VRRLYTLLLYLALPFASLMVLVRGLREREYWRGWRERFGFGAAGTGGGIWVHAVSVGEVQVAALVMRALRARAPSLELTLTCATPTGRSLGRTLLPAIAVSYAPYDLPGSVQRYLARVRPRLLVLIESELWPNLLHQQQRAGTPTLIASARISARSTERYRRLPGLLRAAMQGGVWVAAQSEPDAQRYIALGVPPGRVSVVGNLKFDRVPRPEAAARGAALRSQYGQGRAVWVAGSVHPGVELQSVLAAHRRVREQVDALLVLAPRHPPRFEEMAKLIVSQGWRLLRRSSGVPDPEAQVLLLDTLGELQDFYAAADAAFVGGSLVPIGGHNVLEPAALGVPVLSGPQLFNSPEVARVLRVQGALTVVEDAEALGGELQRLLAEPDSRARQGAAGRAAIEANRGALERVLALIEVLALKAGSESAAVQAL
jgi:3-deoxy-D-manno-octulosonic-acid transferase